MQSKERSGISLHKSSVSYYLKKFFLKSNWLLGLAFWRVRGDSPWLVLLQGPLQLRHPPVFQVVTWMASLDTGGHQAECGLDSVAGTIDSCCLDPLPQHFFCSKNV